MRSALLSFVAKKESTSYGLQVRRRTLLAATSGRRSTDTTHLLVIGVLTFALTIAVSQPWNRMYHSQIEGAQELWLTAARASIIKALTGFFQTPWRRAWRFCKAKSHVDLC